MIKNLSPLKDLGDESKPLRFIKQSESTGKWMIRMVIRKGGVTFEHSENFDVLESALQRRDQIEKKFLKIQSQPKSTSFRRPY